MIVKQKQNNDCLIQLKDECADSPDWQPGWATYSVIVNVHHPRWGTAYGYAGESFHSLEAAEQYYDDMVSLYIQGTKADEVIENLRESAN